MPTKIVYDLQLEEISIVWWSYLYECGVYSIPVIQNGQQFPEAFFVFRQNTKQFTINGDNCIGHLSHVICIPQCLISHDDAMTWKRFPEINQFSNKRPEMRSFVKVFFVVSFIDMLNKLSSLVVVWDPAHYSSTAKLLVLRSDLAKSKNRKTLQWRNNGRDGVSNRLYILCIFFIHIDIRDPI